MSAQQEPTVWTVGKAATLRRVVAIIAISILALTAALVLLSLLGGPHLLLPAADPKGDVLGSFTRKVDDLKTPATAAVGSLAGLGLLAGGAMTGMGMQSGIRMMSLSALTGGGVLLGNGLIS